MTRGRGLHGALVVAASLCVLVGVLIATGADLAILFSAAGAPYLALTAGTVVFALIPRGWSRLVSAGFIALMGVAVLAFAASSLVRPQAMGDFAATLLLVLALVVGVPAAIRSFRAERRREPEPALRDLARDPHGRIVIAVTLAALGALATSVGAWDYARRSLDASAYDIEPDATATIRIARGAFPATTGIPAGQVVELAVTNTEPALHTFTYVAGGVERSHDILPFATTRFLVKLDAGPVQYRCLPHSTSYTDGMVGTLEVGAAG